MSMPRTAEQERRYNLAARARRAERGECSAGCGVVIPAGSPWLVCEACREKQRNKYKPRQEGRLTKVFLSPAERIAIYQRYRNGNQTAAELAADLGKTVASVRSIIQKVGASLDLDAQPMGPRHGPRSSPREDYPRCKCGLLLPCWDCVTAVSAGARRGPGYVYPAGE